MTNKLITAAKVKENDGDILGAIELYKVAWRADSKNIFLQIEIGNLYALIEDYEEAAGFFRRSHHALKNNQPVTEALVFCLIKIGNTYFNKREFKMAANAFEEALSFNENNAPCLFNYGNALFHQNKYDEAIKAYSMSLRIKPDAKTYNNLGNALQRILKTEEAISSYEKALLINPDLIHTFIQMVHLKQSICDWGNIDEMFSKIKKIIENPINEKIPPFALFSMPNLTNNDHLNVANSWVKQSGIQILKKSGHQKKGKITLAYLSSDFRLHPLYYLIKEVLINHDRDKFDVKLFYSGPDDGSKELDEFRDIGDTYFNITEMSDEKVSGLMVKERIDIMVDLTGFTQNSRSLIAALRPAKLHINWLGYPGSMGGIGSRPLYDFILADKYVIPKSKRKDYAEKIIYLEGCYQPNIASRPTLKTVNKLDYGFKKNDFIFASFGQSLKITKEMFSLWMRLLQKVPNSILWLLTSNQTCENNLRAFADNKFGIQAERLFFAKKVSFDDHIQRHQIIDVFLDTFPYNAHTSSSDALWAGCPIISFSGETFASRVAGSILSEIGCTELIVSSIEEYEKKAIELASKPDKIVSLKQKILDLKKTSNLFKPKKFTIDLEGKMIKLMG